ncbi:MAG: response regulator [Chloroflexota bacterium]
MSSGRILVVEDDFDISNMLRIYFTGQGYQVEVAARGGDALDMCRRKLPDLVVLDIMLPDMDGYAVCRELRTTTRTSHIPVIFLTQKDERSDKIAGLELGADDYITKPFDIEELKLRVRSAIRAHQRLNMTDPRTGLPSGRLIEEQLRGLMRRDDWTFLLIGIEHIDVFNDAYGFVAGDEVLRFAALLFSDIVDSLGTDNDFLGHASNETFTIITFSPSVDEIIAELRDRFETEVRPHYNFMDSERGGVALHDGTLGPLMTLSVGVVSARNDNFADIREITEMAAERRRLEREEKV